jgi:hypothetical protein
MTLNKQFQQCEYLYNGLLKAAGDNVVNGFHRYSGMITHLADDLGFTIEQYSKANRALKMMGCIKEVRKGARNTPTELNLIKPPTIEEWAELGNERNISRPMRERFERIEQANRDQEERITKLEKALEAALEGVA